MTGIALTTVNYEDQAGQVTWRGVSMRDDAEFNTLKRATPNLKQSFGGYRVRALVTSASTIF